MQIARHRRNKPGRRSMLAAPCWLSWTGLLLLPLAGAGCSDEFDPPSLLTGTRILALLASPGEAGPGDSIQVQSVVYAPDAAQPVTSRWTFCPLTPGAFTGFVCAFPECETALTPEADGTVRVNPAEQALACVSRLGAAGGSSTGSPPGELPESVDTLFRLVVQGAAGTEQEAVLRVPLWITGPPAQRNLPPVIGQVTADGQVLPLTGEVPLKPIPPGGKLSWSLTVDPTSLQPYEDGTGAARTEQPVVSWYATAGRFEFDRTNDGGTVEWTADDEPEGDSALVYAVVRDLRGGQAAGGPWRIALAMRNEE